MIAVAARYECARGDFKRGFEAREELLAEGKGSVKVGFHEGAEADKAVG